MGRKWRVIIVAVVLVAALGVVGCESLSGAQEEAGLPEETAVAREGTLVVAVEATGSLVPHSEVSLSFSSGGRVEAVLVEEGQFVEAGQALVRLETDELALQVAQAEVTLAAVEAQLAQLWAPPRTEELAVQGANLRAMESQVSAAAASRDQVVAGAGEGEVASAEAELASAIAEQNSAFDRHEKTMTCVTISIPPTRQPACTLSRRCAMSDGQLCV
jgi:multidrug efflux pump subunit AcrA (membrane-fusion protein)